MTNDEQYYYGSTPLGQVRNRNELRIIKMLPQVLNQYGDAISDSIDIQDIYAIALNKLPAHYVQETAIVLQESVDDETLLVALDEAVQVVRKKPNHT